MRKITAIEAQKNNPHRVNVHLDGEFAFGLTRVVAAWLRVGQRLSEQKIAELQAQDARERAYQQALLYLSYRARSEAEIRQNLRKHEIPAEVIEAAIERLRQEHLANDHQFARAWVENRNTFRPRSRRALALELRQKGLEDEIIQSALEGVDDEALAYAAGLRKARRLEAHVERSAALSSRPEPVKGPVLSNAEELSQGRSGLEWPEFRRKLTEFLARRGFSYSVIAPLVVRIWNETRQGQEKPIPEDEETI